jgi:hypothetical protein
MRWAARQWVGVNGDGAIDQIMRRRVNKAVSEKIQPDRPVYNGFGNRRIGPNQDKNA